MPFALAAMLVVFSTAFFGSATGTPPPGGFPETNSQAEVLPDGGITEPLAKVTPAPSPVRVPASVKKGARK